jgi:hypothetical protein
MYFYMNKHHLCIVVIAIVAAVGAVGIVSAISSVTEAQARSCSQERVGCHGCASTSQGAIITEGKCIH